jgi:RNA polymerase sigma factor (sigma-70 family)
LAVPEGWEDHRTVLREDDAELYAKVADELVRFASAVVGPGGAEDVVATAVLACFATPSWASISNRRAYLYRAVLNEALKVRHATARRLTAASRAAVVEDELDAAVGVDVIRALCRLSVRQRAVLYLTYWEDLTPSETARRLGLSLRTVERDLASGRRQLRRLLS